MSDYILRHLNTISTKQSNDDRVYGAIQYVNTNNVTAVIILVLVYTAVVEMLDRYLTKFAKTNEIEDIYKVIKYKLLGKYNKIDSF